MEVVKGPPIKKAELTSGVKRSPFEKSRSSRLYGDCSWVCLCV